MVLSIWQYRSSTPDDIPTTAISGVGRLLRLLLDQFIWWRLECFARLLGWGRGSRGWSRNDGLSLLAGLPFPSEERHSSLQRVESYGARFVLTGSEGARRNVAINRTRCNNGGRFEWHGEVCTVHRQARLARETPLKALSWRRLEMMGFSTRCLPFRRFNGANKVNNNSVYI